MDTGHWNIRDRTGRWLSREATLRNWWVKYQEVDSPYRTLRDAIVALEAIGKASSRSSCMHDRAGGSQQGFSALSTGGVDNGRHLAMERFSNRVEVTIKMKAYRCCHANCIYGRELADVCRTRVQTQSS